MGFLAQFFFPGGQSLALSLCPGGGEFALSGGWSGLELTDTLYICILMPNLCI